MIRLQRPLDGLTITRPWRRKEAKAECHPDKPWYSGGLCRNCYARAQYRKHPERHRAASAATWKNTPIEVRRARGRKRRYRLLYGLTIERYNELLERQNGRCAVCAAEFSTTKKAYVDHNHSTGQVRGILCNLCNIFVGYLEKHEGMLSQAFSYLDQSARGGVL